MSSTVRTEVAGALSRIHRDSCVQHSNRGTHFFPVSYRRGEGEALLRLLLHLHRLPPVVILQELLLVQRAGGDRRRLVALAPLRILASQLLLLLLPGSLLALALLGVQLDVVVEVLVLRHVVLQGERTIDEYAAFASYSVSLTVP